MLSRIVVGASIARPKEIHLTKYGQITETAIKNIPQHYPAVSVDNYVIMPDHIHILLQIHSDNNGKPMVTQSIKKVIQQVKGIITKQIGFSMWQKGFYDHIVRCENDYLDIWQYIDNNPYKYN
jgi:REP element-mobilizing transposase RayT